ncbi:MAG: SDR family NAD(P)-dependent oxidoreductase [Marmoricola sp.]
MTDLAHYGPWAVIAGGSEGVGAEFALQLAQAGVNLVLIARKPGPLEETAQQARAKGVEVRTLAVDLTSAQSISVITEATSDLEVGLLIYTAGANSYGHAFTEGDLSGFLGVLDLNVNAMLALTHHFALPMKQRRRGGILLVGLSGRLCRHRHRGHLRRSQGIRPHLRRGSVVRVARLRRTRVSSCLSHPHPGHGAGRAGVLMC